MNDTRRAPDAVAAELAERVAAQPAPPLLPADLEPPIDLPWPDCAHAADGARRW